MTEEAQDTPEEETQDTPAVPPVPEVSETSPQEASPQPTFDVDAIADRVVEKLGPTLDSKVDQRFKKTTDPRFADVRKVASYLDAAGGDAEKAAREMMVDQMLEGQDTSEGPAGTVSKEELDAQILAETTIILDGAGIAYNDPRYVALQEQYKDRISHPSVWKSVLSTAMEQWAKQEGVTSAAVVSTVGGTVTSEDAEELAAELAQLQRPGPNEPGVTHPDNIARRKEIDAKLKTLTPQRPDIK